MTIRQQIEQQLKEVTITPDQSQLKNELIEAEKWHKSGKTSFPPDGILSMNYEDGVKYALEWVLGLTPHNPIQEEYQEE